jgi:hypothetical protein
MLKKTDASIQAKKKKRKGTGVLNLTRSIRVLTQVAEPGKIAKWWSSILFSL